VHSTLVASNAFSQLIGRIAPSEAGERDKGKPGESR